MLPAIKRSLDADPILAGDILGVFNRDVEMIVRIKRPGRRAIEARIDPDDVPKFVGHIRSAAPGAPIDVSMLFGFEESE